MITFSIVIASAILTLPPIALATPRRYMMSLYSILITGREDTPKHNRRKPPPDGGEEEKPETLIADRLVAMACSPRKWTVQAAI